MSLKGKLAVKVHQSLSFSSFLAKLESAPVLFWPGCSLMNLGPDILHKSLAILQREIPEMRLASYCCGQPSYYVLPKDYPKHEAKTQKLLKEAGIKTICTACANCYQQMKDWEGLEVKPVYELLARNIQDQDLVKSDLKEIALHDPCPFRKEKGVHQAARELIAKTGVKILDCPNQAEKTRCCGNIHLMNALQEEKSKKMRLLRLGDFPEDATICSYCQGCLNSFAGEGRKTIHLLELLLGQVPQKGWGQRLKYARSLN